MDGMKQCRDCGEVKAFSEFMKKKQMKNGVGSYCKKCQNKRMTKSRESNPERKLRVYRKYYEANFNKIKERSRRWHSENLEKANESLRNAGAKKLGAVGRITAQEWKDLCEKYGNKCLCCKREDVKLTLDHILPLSQGGLNSIENAQPLCGPCNTRKKDKHIDYRP